MAVYETKDIHKFEELRTRYYTNSYDQCKTRVLEIAKNLGYEVMNVDDRYSEIFLSGKKYTIIVRITSFNPRETGIDFYLQSRSGLDFGKGKKHVILWNEELGKGLSLKGISLHING